MVGTRQATREVSIVTQSPEPPTFFAPLETSSVETYKEYKKKLGELDKLKTELLCLIEESHKLLAEYLKRHKHCKPWIAKYQSCRGRLERKREEIITKI